MVRKAIPEERDRLQSRLLVGMAVPVLAVLIGTQVRQALAQPSVLLVVLAISLGFALAAWRLRAATPAAAAFGAAICLAVMLSTTMPARSPLSRSLLFSGLTPLLLLFVLTFCATRAGRARKLRSGLAESRSGRSAAQVLANLGAAAVVSSLPSLVASRHQHGATSRSVELCGAIAMLAAFTEATADTVSSEIGQAFGGNPVSVLTLRRMPPGTDGAISRTGTLAGSGGAAVVALSGIFALGLTVREVAIAFVAGLAGFFLDSVLGATLEMRGWLGNDLVNLASTSAAAWLAWALARWR